MRASSGRELLVRLERTRCSRKKRHVQRKRMHATGESDAPLDPMDVEDARSVLGLGRDSSFEDALGAKNKLLVQAGNDFEKKMKVEAAYDVLLMDSLNRRQTGNIDPNIRFADVRKLSPSKTKDKLPGWTSKIDLPTFRVPPGEEIALSAALFVGLGTWSLLEDVLRPGGGPTIPGFQLALGYGISVYLQRDKRRQTMGRANLLSFVGVAMGAALGGIIEGWLRVDIVPIGGLDSGAVLVSEFVFLALWFASTFLD